MKARQACVQGLMDIMEQDTASTHRLTLDKGRRVKAPSSKTDRALRRAAMVKTDGLRDGGAKRPTDQPGRAKSGRRVDLSIQHTQTGAEIRRQSRDEAIQQTAHETNGRCRPRKSTRRVDFPHPDWIFSAKARQALAPRPFPPRLAWLSWCHLAGGSLLCAALCRCCILLLIAIEPVSSPCLGRRPPCRDEAARLSHPEFWDRLPPASSLLASPKSCPPPHLYLPSASLPLSSLPSPSSTT
ncbi:hypothetical protein L1887_50617 [Cichorium endivia]|nr:hypothetical protein L1887_50617 [Cichorium endivia]